MADSLSLPIIKAIRGIIRAIGAAIRKVVLTLVRLKISPIMGGPMVIPSVIMVPYMALKPARCSKGATDVAMTRWQGRFNP